jgi:hypothetical protein
MAGSKIDRPGGTPAQDLEGYDRRGGIPVTQVGLDPGSGENAGGLLGKPLPHETGITADYNALMLFTPCSKIVRYGLDHHLDIVKGEILAQDTAPTGRSEGNTRHRKPPDHNKTAFVVLQ